MKLFIGQIDRRSFCMGSWGLTNLQNDIAEDVKSDYISLLQKGKTGEEATKELTLQYEDAIADLDDAPVFWLALADVQWDYGSLEKHVGEKAQYYIKQELTQWNTPNYQEAEGESVSREQRCFLVKLQRKLLSEQPNEKKDSSAKIISMRLGKWRCVCLQADERLCKRKGVDK